MRIKQLTAAGLRGFNSERSIEFHDKLTLISAANSHGKTSVTEALEFLLYGQTSKVESADSKEEYKDSYRNRHYPPEEIVYVEAHCADGTGKDVILRVELQGTELRRFIDGKPVTVWPFSDTLNDSARPFVIQHALKKLLLAAPSDRFQGFARLLGLQEVDSVQQALVNLCIKPEAHLSADARRTLENLELFEGRLGASKGTSGIAKSLAAAVDGVDNVYAKLHEIGLKLVGKKVSEAELSGALVVLRNAAAGKVYSGTVAIATLSSGEAQRSAVARDRIDRTTQVEFIDKYSKIAVGDARDRISKHAQLLGLGIEIINDSPESCPFCDQALTESMRSHVKQRHADLLLSIGPGISVSTARADMAALLKELGASLASHAAIHAGRSKDLAAANSPEASQKIKALFGKGNEDSLFLVAAAGKTIEPSQRTLMEAHAKVSIAIEVCEDALRTKSEDLAQVETLVKAINEYLAQVDRYSKTLEEVAPTLAEPTRLLQKAVDEQAGTTELSLLVEMLSARTAVRVQ